MGEQPEDGRLPVVAVVDAEGEHMAVWWVALDGATGSESSRLAGAWVVPADSNRLASLVAERHLLVCPGAKALARASGLDQEEWFDPDGSRAAILDERHALAEVHAEYLTGISAGRARTLVEPQWPEVLSPLKHVSRNAERTGALADGTVNEGAESEPLAQSALRVAQWVKRLGACWEELEAVRISRKHLRAARAHEPRPFPIRHGKAEVV